MDSLIAVLKAMTLAPLILISPSCNLHYWTFFLILHAIAAATQDVSIDAMVINVVCGQE